MLYLMMQKTDGEYLVKVGYSDGKGRIANRRATYYSHNPRAIMRSTCAGSTSMECTCRDMLAIMDAQRIPRTEWFVVSPELFATLYQEGMRYFLPKLTPIHFLEEFAKTP